jgi:hypothetical protein
VTHALVHAAAAVGLFKAGEACTYKRRTRGSRSPRSECVARPPRPSPEAAVTIERAIAIVILAAGAVWLLQHLGMLHG